MVDFKVEVPGTYILVDHALFRAFNKGALGMLKVEGPANLIAYSGKEVDAVYLGHAAEAGGAGERRLSELQAQMKEAIKSDPKIAGLTKDLQIEKGRKVFMETCYACHQTTGEGLPDAFPPLAKSDYLMADRDRSIRALIQGLTGPIEVNGKKWDSSMPTFDFTDEQIANVLTFVRNNFGNTGDPVAIDQVRLVRSQLPPP